MGSDYSTLFHNKPFPVNTGDLQIVHLQERTTPAYGQSKIPHVEKYPSYPRDAMGRIVIEDGIDRLHAGWLPLHVVVMRHFISAEIFFSILLRDTYKLNVFMKKYKMIAFCVISFHEVLVLCVGDYEKICKKNPKYKSPNHAIETTEYNGIETALSARLDAGPNRLNGAQLHEVIMRMGYAYRKYGVGALVMHEDKFSYRIIVPNRTEYTNHKAAYDDKERTLRIGYDINHTSSKRTRSGKKFDGGSKRTRFN
jgi:hypothetical protein